MTTEQEDDFYLRKAAEFLAHCRENENEARKELARLIEQTRRAKEKHEAIFMEAERHAAKRILASDSCSKNY